MAGVTVMRKHGVCMLLTSPGNDWDLRVDSRTLQWGLVSLSRTCGAVHAKRFLRQHPAPSLSPYGNQSEKKAITWIRALIESHWLSSLCKISGG